MTVEEKIANLQAQLDELKSEVNKREKTLHKGDIYYAVSSYGYVDTYNYRDDELDQKFINCNNIFDSSPNAEEHLQWYIENVIKVQNRLMQLHEQLCPDYFPDWKSNNTKYNLYFDFNAHKWRCWESVYYNRFAVYFTEEAAKAAADILNAEKFMMK